MDRLRYSDQGWGSLETLMFFDSPGLARGPQDRSEKRRALVNQVIGVCRDCFSSISIRLLEDVAVINAQASQIRGVALVDLFGGLAFHPAVGTDALAFSLLHEIGHHLGNGPRIAPNNDMACDCAADGWAIVEGLPRLAERNLLVNIPVALAQIQEATRLLTVTPEGLSSRNCWSSDWNRRRQVLIDRGITSISRCTLTGSSHTRLAPDGRRNP